MVEDDLTSASAMQKILSRRGWNVTVAHTLAEGMAKLSAASISAVELDWMILDLMLPDGSGEAILRRVRDEQIRVKVAVTTAVSDSERLEEVRRLQPDSLFAKPLDLGRLLDRLEGMDQGQSP